MRENFRASETDYELIDMLSDILTANNISHDMHPSDDGWQITFDWCDGDVLCSSVTLHYLESYKFPWDEDDITRAAPEEMARMIFDYYHDIITKK